MSPAPRQGKAPLVTTALVAAAIAALTWAAYWPVLKYPFVEWDDPGHVRDNPHVRSGITRDNFVWSWGIHGPSQWHPVAWWSHQLDSQLFGAKAADAWKHHATSLLWHSAAAVVLLLALRRLTGQFWPSAMVAALFALHPLSVESVAWISERRDVLSAFFFALTLWAYAAYAQQGGAVRYALVVLSFALGLMSKPMLVTLPCVLLLLDYWPLRRMPGWLGFKNDQPLSLRERPGEGEAEATSKALTPALSQRERGSTTPAAAQIPTSDFRPPTFLWLLLEKFPLLALSGISAWLSYKCQEDVKAIASLSDYSLASRAANAIQAYVLYLRNMVWPWNLGPMYPLPTSFSTWKVAAALVVLTAVTGAVFWFARRCPYLPVGWLWYLGTLLPVIGLLRMGIEVSMADRWVYLPLIGLYIVVVWGAGDLLRRLPHAAAVAGGLAAGVLVACLVLTVRQVEFWRDSEALYGRAIEVDTRVPVAHLNLGSFLEERGETIKAIKHYRKAIELRRGYADAYTNLGNAYMKLHRLDRALPVYEFALRLNPKLAEAHYNYGVALQGLNRVDDAARHYHAAIQLKPEHVEAHYNFGIALKDLGQTDAAAAQFLAAVKLNPDHAAAHYNLGYALNELGRTPEAIEQFRAAIALEPVNPAAHYNLGKSLLSQGQTAAAIDELRLAVEQGASQNDVKSRAGRANAHSALASALRSMGRTEEAAQQQQAAQQLSTNSAEARYARGVQLQSAGQLDEAAVEFRAAIAESPRNATAHNALGAIFARQGHLREALEQFRIAVSIDPNHAAAQRNLRQAEMILQRQPQQ